MQTEIHKHEATIHNSNVEQKHDILMSEKGSVSLSMKIFGIFPLFYNLFEESFMSGEQTLQDDAHTELYYLVLKVWSLH